MSVLGIVLLILIGVLLILLEILVIPGVTVAGIAGFLFIGGGVYFAYEINTFTGNSVLIGSIVFVLLSLYYTLKAGTWKKVWLSAEIDGKVNTIEENVVKVGDTGIAISRLAPIGKVLINNSYFEARAKNKLIDQEKEVVVLKVDRSNLIVDEYIKEESED